MERNRCHSCTIAVKPTEAFSESLESPDVVDILEENVPLCPNPIFFGEVWGVYATNPESYCRAQKYHCCNDMV
jgi:hypothetical protein